MSYAPPPGLEASRVAPPSSRQSHASLPPRPPPPAGPPSAFTPAFSSGPGFAAGAPGTASYPGGPGAAPAPGAFIPFRARQVGVGGGVGAALDWRNQTTASTISAAPAPSPSYSALPGHGAPFAPPQTPYSAGAPATAQSYYQAPPVQGAFNSISSPPQIRNPFPLPGQEPHHGGPARGRGANRYQDPSIDPELEAQIAQWQSAYISKDAAEQSASGAGRGAGRGSNRSGASAAEGPASASGANAGPLGGRADAAGGAHAAASASASGGADADSGAAAAASGTNGADGKQKTVVRSGGGQSWTDSTLLEWDPAHFRLFVGNLAGEVTDDSLLKAFARYPSVQKARVVRDKRTTKSKGYGFVSFSDGDEYFQAAKEMQGKYIGSHPVLLRRSTTEIRPVAQSDKKGKTGKGGKASSTVIAASAAKTGAGVHKKANKTKGGLRVLG